MGTVLSIFSFSEQITPNAHPLGPPYVKILILIIEKKIMLNFILAWVLFL